MSSHVNFFEFSNVEVTTTITEVEELRPVIVDGEVYPAYSISNLGNVYSHKVGRMIDRRRSNLISISHIDGKVNGRGGASYVSLSLGNGKNKRFTVHKLVMNAFKPVDEYPPIPMKDYLNCPETARQWIRKTVIINHIDHNPHNNVVENLEYTTQHENTIKAVKHHGGCLNNKNKNKKVNKQYN